jgi:hypothetical protein
VTRSLSASARKRKNKRKPDPPLFQDGFKRPDGRGWGDPWFNQRYGRNWRIKEHRGLIRLPPSESNVDYKPIPIVVLDHDVRNVDLRASLSVSNKTMRAGLFGRMVGYSDFYAAHIGPGNHVRIVRCGLKDEKILKKRDLHIDENRRYRFRLQVRGSRTVKIRCKIWPVGRPEPFGWTVQAEDDSTGAIPIAGAFGVYVQHATDGRGSVARVGDVVARSEEKGDTTPPVVTYSLAGIPVADGTKVKVVAKITVPGHVFFQYGTEPTLTTGVGKVRAGLANSRSLTVKKTLDLARLGDPSIVYWRAYAERKGVRVDGPISSFKPRRAAGLPVRFAFGACTQWSAKPHDSFEQARLRLPDFYLHQGDFGYVAHRVIAHSRDTYQDHWIRMLGDSRIAALTREVPFVFYRDDADYGRNQADARTFRRFTVGAHGELNANPSNDYFEFRYGDVAFFCLDCRRYSTGELQDRSKRSKLGSRQKAWLKSSMIAARNEGAGVLVVGAPQAFGSDATPASWRKTYQNEWEELIDFFDGLGAPVLIVSGDAHGHRLFEFPQKQLPDGTPRIVEFLSAGTEHKNFSDEVDEEFFLDELGKNKEPGFGMVEIGPEQSIGGQQTRTLGLSAIRSSDGTEMWRKSYLIVRGVGILPLTL